MHWSKNSHVVEISIGWDPLESVKPFQFSLFFTKGCWFWFERSIRAFVMNCKKSFTLQNDPLYPLGSAPVVVGVVAIVVEGFAVVGVVVA